MTELPKHYSDSDTEAALTVARDAIAFQAEFLERHPLGEAPAYLDGKAEAMLSRALLAFAAADYQRFHDLRSAQAKCPCRGGK